MPAPSLRRRRARRPRPVLPVGRHPPGHDHLQPQRLAARRQRRGEFGPFSSCSARALMRRRRARAVRGHTAPSHPLPLPDRAVPPSRPWPSSDRGSPRGSCSLAPTVSRGVGGWIACSGPVALRPSWPRSLRCRRAAAPRARATRDRLAVAMARRRATTSSAVSPRARRRRRRASSSASRAMGHENSPLGVPTLGGDVRRAQRSWRTTRWLPPREWAVIAVQQERAAVRRRSPTIGHRDARVRALAGDHPHAASADAEGSDEPPGPPRGRGDRGERRVEGLADEGARRRGLARRVEKRSFGLMARCCRPRHPGIPRGLDGRRGAERSGADARALVRGGALEPANTPTLRGSDLVAHDVPAFVVRSSTVLPPSSEVANAVQRLGVAQVIPST